MGFIDKVWQRFSKKENKFPPHEGLPIPKPKPIEKCKTCEITTQKRGQAPFKGKDGKISNQKGAHGR